jgi:hypothetical protein
MLVLEGREIPSIEDVLARKKKFLHLQKPGLYKVV